jgi:hypothetical protein
MDDVGGKALIETGKALDGAIILKETPVDESHGAVDGIQLNLDVAAFDDLSGKTVDFLLGIGRGIDVDRRGVSAGAVKLILELVVCVCIG